MNISELYENIKQLFQPYITRQWDGSPSRWPDTESYCNSCLIDVNPEGEDKVQSLCKLPVKDPGSDTINPEGLEAAAGGRGITQVTKPANVEQSTWDEAVQSAANEIISAYQSVLDRDAPDSVYEVAGREPPGEDEDMERAMSFGRIREIVWSKLYDIFMGMEDYYLIDVYVDDNSFYALCLIGNQLSRYLLAVEGDELILGELEPVMEVHQPVTTRTTITRQADGRYRWFSVSGTAVLNRSGEIDSRDLFDSFIEYAQQTGNYPIRQFYHSGEAFRTGQATHLFRDEYCYITSGLYDDTPLALAEVAARQNNPDYWGDSIGFMPTVEPELSPISDGINIPVYRQGINTEISTLPESEAAHLFTRTEVQRMSLDGKAWEAFIQLWDGDEARARQWLDDNPQARNRAIEDNGLITREDNQSTEQDDAKQDNEIVIDDDVIELVSRSVVESEAIANLSTQLEELKNTLTEYDTSIIRANDTIEKLTQRLDKLEGTQQAQERQVEQDKPAKFRNGRTRVVHKPREANSNGEQPNSTDIAEATLARIRGGN